MNPSTNFLNQKIELIRWLSTIEDATIIDKITNLRNEKTHDWWNAISENEKKSIERGLKDSEEGKLNPHSKARDLYEKWL